MRPLALIVCLLFSSATLAQAAPGNGAQAAIPTGTAGTDTPIVDPTRPADTATPADTPAQPAQPAWPPTVNVFKLDLGQLAPFSGVLLDEQTFLRYLKSQIALEEAGWRIAARDRQLVAAETSVARTWEEKYGLIIGLGLGFAGGVALLLTARSLVK